MTSDAARVNYIGETARSVGERFDEHFKKYIGKQKSSVFYQHALECHQGNVHPLDVKVISQCTGDAMLRQVTEAVMIKEIKPLLNMKEEWGKFEHPLR